MSEEISRFIQILKILYTANSDPWQNSSSSVLKVLGRVAGRYPFITAENHLVRLLPSTELRQVPEPARHYLYLPPIARGGHTQIPVLAWKFSIEAKPVMLSLVLGLFQIESATDNLRALGLRFEMPEEPGDDASSRHGYCHAQICEGFTRDNPFSDENGQLTPGWLPDSYPCFPLPSRTPADLVICMLISLYGIRLTRDLAVLLRNDLVRVRTLMGL